jgi:DHA1 family bicyclomycin/chloramphenicol resistance-like MFS transporter
MHARPGLVIALVSALIAIGQVATSIYLPSMPAMTVALATDGATMQLTLTAYLVGFAISQLVYGPLSDRYGRRPLLFAGLVLYVAASAACALAGTIDELIVARLFQSMGACAGPVVGRAVVRDLYDGEAAARVLGYVGVVMAVSPAFAPVLGSHLHGWFGWRANFIFVAIFGAAIGVVMWRSLGETHEPDPQRGLGLGRMAASYWTLLGSPTFLAHTLCLSLAFTGLFVYISESPFVFIEMLGVSERAFGWYSLSGVGAFAASSLVAGRFAGRFTIVPAVLVGSAIMATGGLLMAGIALSGVFNIAAILGPMMVIAAGMGIVLPFGMAGAMSANPRSAGAASALFGLAQFGFAALGTVLIGAVRDGTHIPMAVIMAAATLAAAASLSILARPERGEPQNPQPATSLDGVADGR